MQPGPADGHLFTDYDTMRKAPEHIVELVLGLIRQHSTGAGHRTVMPPQHRAAAELEQARDHADRIWAEAAHAGAVWAMARERPVIHVNVHSGDDNQLSKLVDQQDRKATPL